MFNPPTDNIHKFSAIFGLIIIFSSSYYTFNKNLDLELQENSLNTEKRILALQVVDLEKKVNNLKEEVESTIGNTGIIKKEEFIQYQNLLSEYESNLLELEKIAEQKVGKEDALAIYKNAVKTYFIIFFISLFMGSALSIFGFYYWYKSESK